MWLRTLEIRTVGHKKTGPGENVPAREVVAGACLHHPQVVSPGANSRRKQRSVPWRREQGPSRLAEKTRSGGRPGIHPRHKRRRIIEGFIEAPEAWACFHGISLEFMPFSAIRKPFRPLNATVKSLAFKARALIDPLHSSRVGTTGPPKTLSVPAITSRP